MANTSLSLKELINNPKVGTIQATTKKSNKSCDNTEVNVIFFILFGLVYACIGSRLK
jgi:hypothetical protein